jgi:16S rRNA (cytosine967-C5)-methyltransferase
MNAASLIGHVTELLSNIEHSRLPADAVASPFFRERSYLGARDRRFIAETVYGIIRHRRYLEALLEHYLAGHPSDTALDAAPRRFLTLCTAYDLTRARPEQSVPFPETLWKTAFPSVDPARWREWISSNAMLEDLAMDPSVRLGVMYSFQDWMIEDWAPRLGENLEALLRGLNAPSTITLRVNLLKTTRDACRERLLEEGIETSASPISPAGLIAAKRFSAHSSPAFREGWFELQDEGSQIVSLIADPRPGEFVVDACAGAGGKTLHLAQLMNDTGEIVAIDVERRRLAELFRRARRAGLRSVQTRVRSEFDPGPLAGKADCVLVDAPCSGVGTIRRNPGLKWSVTPALVGRFAEQQRELLASASRFVRPGGRLIYATCSLLREENEEVMEAFLGAAPDFALFRPAGHPELPEAEGREGTITLFPHLHHTDGFFIAAMRRAGG